MKKFSFIFLMLITSFAFAQNAPIDFETGGHGADWTWTVFENDTGQDLEIVDNPAATGINTSAKVAKFTALQSGQPWAGVESAHGADLGSFVLDQSNCVVKIMVYKTEISDVGIKLVSSNGWSEGEIKVANTVVNEWEELTFDFSGYVNPPDGEGQLDQIAIFPDFNLDGRTQDNIVYFDNITFNAGSGTTDGPTAAAPAPTHDAANVLSVFSDAYTGVAGTDFNPAWGQTTVVTTEAIDGNDVLKYANLNYQGTQFATALNVSEMEYLHVDMWTADASAVNFFCISSGPVETAYSLPITANQWVSYDIPLSEFTDVDLADIIQFKIDGGTGTETIYLDNIYFYKTGAVVSDATLSDLQVDGSTITGFSPSIYNYEVVLSEGTTAVPTVTAVANDPEADVQITPATAIPGTTSIVVTSADAQNELTYTVDFSVQTTSEGAIDFEPDGRGADWTWTVFENDTDPALEIVDNPAATGINTSAKVAKFTALQSGQPWAGVESAHGADLGSFVLDETNCIIKIMVYKTEISDVGIKLISPTGWSEGEIKVANTVVNEWEELTFDFSGYVNPPAEEGQLDQIAIFPDFNLDGRTQDNIVYFDNITFNPAGGTSDEPTVAAPAPTHDAVNVLSVFSDAYTDIAGTNFNPAWGQTTVVTTEAIDGNDVLKYADLNYQGTEFASALNVSEMEYLHVDMWTSDASDVNISCISTGPVETAYSLPITANQWASYDIPLSEFTDVDLTDVIQFKIDGGSGTETIYLDNIYFYKTGAVVSDATLSDLQVDGTTINGFAPAIHSYEVVLPEGTAAVPTVTAVANDPEADVQITPATAIPGTTSIVVTSADAENEITYTVAFSIQTSSGEPTTAAPAPTHDAADVISLFSRAYTDVAVDTWRTDWSSADYEEVEIDGITTKKYANLDFVGVETTTAQLNITDMTHLHIDIWSADFTFFGVKLVDFGADGAYGGGDDTEHQVDFETPAQGEWVSLDIPLSDFVNLQNHQNIAQYIFVGQPTGSTTVFVDNVYFYKTGGTASSDATLSDLLVDGTTIDGFSPSVFDYEIELPAGTTDVPVVTATTNHNAASVLITDASALPGTTTIQVTAEDNTVQNYTVQFTVSTDIPAIGKDDMKVYANNATIYIDGTSEIINGKIEIYNSIGKRILFKDIRKTNEQITLRSKGIVIVRIFDANNNVISVDKLFVR